MDTNSFIIIFVLLASYYFFFKKFKIINDDINSQMGYFNIGVYIGDPRHISQSSRNYPNLDTLRDTYFQKYIDNIHQY